MREVHASTSSVMGELKEQLSDVQGDLESKRFRCEYLEEKMEVWRNKVRNIKKKVARRETKLHDAEKKVEREVLSREALQAELDGLCESVEEVKLKLNREQHRVHSQKKKAECLEESLEDFKEQARDMTVKCGELSKEIAFLRNEVDVQQNIIDELLGSDQMIVTKVDGKYTDEVRQCCFDLLSMNVGVWNIQPVIKAVLALAKKSCEELPSIGLLSKMLVELKAVSSVHAAEELLKDDVSDHTLHSDGTTKFGRKFQSYQIGTTDKTLSIGLVDMRSGTAEQTMDIFKQVLTDIERVVHKVDQVEQDTAKRILSKIKNTMSDRSIVQKISMFCLKTTGRRSCPM